MIKACALLNVFVRSDAKTYRSGESECMAITNKVKAKATKMHKCIRKEHLLQMKWNSLAI